MKNGLAFSDVHGYPSAGQVLFWGRDVKSKCQIEIGPISCKQK